jgi:cellulose 1,4-beta-cellobiosidase
MFQSTIVGIALSAVVVDAQQKGTLKTNYHMPVSLEECTSVGCSANTEAKLTLDANWRWTHSASGSSNCYTGNQWDSTLCPDGVTCAKNCALGAVPSDEWSGTIGVKEATNGVTLDFVTIGPYSKNVGSRLYVMEGTEYKMFKMLNKEISFDVDMSNMPCGLNGAVYFVEMDKDGNKGGNNAAGAEYGTGYCDGQCARDIKFVQGEANIKDWTVSTSDPWSNSGTGLFGSCCAEMDLWEANSMSTAFTPHPSNKAGLSICQGDSECGAQDGDRYIAPTDRDGCDINSYRMGETTFYGPGASFTVDTSKPFTVVTQFHAPSGVLESINQWYIQGGKRIDHPDYLGMGNAETDAFCSAQKEDFGDTDDFSTKGGMKVMGEALDRGMVLVISLWDDISVYMNWLDSYDPKQDPSKPGVKRGSCSPTEGEPETLRNAHPDSHYTFSNLMLGDIDTTHPDFPPSPTPPSPTPPSPTPPSPTPPSPTPPTPTPSDCPGGSLSACLDICPKSPAEVYQICVQTCLDRCFSSLMV